MLFCIGDIHGYFDKLTGLIAHCRNFAESRGGQSAEFILLGDYVDRGPASRQVLEFLASKPVGISAICGNHEDLMIEALNGGEDLDRWLLNGGVATLDSFGVSDVHKVPSGHFRLLAELPLFVDDGIRLFVHAGIDWKKPDERQRQTLLWTRNHPPDDLPLARFLVHGHTPVRGEKPDLRPNRLNLDTGAGLGRRLSAAAFAPGNAGPVAFLNDLGEVSLLAPPDAS